MKRTWSRIGTMLGAIALLASPLAVSAAEGKHKGLILRVAKPYDSIEAAIRGVGGDVTYRFQNVNAIAVNVPEGRLADVMALVGASKLYKDPMVASPTSVVRPGKMQGAVGGAVLDASSARALDAAALKETLAKLPADYNFNNNSIGASVIHSAGNFGQGVVVAVIDAGTANSPNVPAIAPGTVIGGENFVAADPIQSATSRRNGAHGTWVGTVIAGNVIFGFLNTSNFIASLKEHAPTAILEPCPAPPAAAVCGVPQIGVAPLASLYAMKVFDSRGGGSPESRIIAAMDRALTLKTNYNNGVPSTPVAGDGSEDNPYRYDSLNIGVVNMSLGGGTAFAGRDLEDELTTQMVAAGIVLVTSAGNDGFAAMTGGSPGTGFGSLTVGAASSPTHERIVADLFFVGLGNGKFYRPFNFLQTADFSARGPTADGRLDPEITANGAWTWAEGTCQTSAACQAGTGLAPINFVSGTSFSGPTVAGAAALLRSVFPSAPAGSVRNALVAGANPNVLKDNSGPIDQGSGYLDIPAAAFKLNKGISAALPTPPPAFPTVERNIARRGFRPVKFDKNGVFSTHVADLVPGQVSQFFVDAGPFTDQIKVDLTNITPELPPAQQNPFFTDDFFVQVADAPTSFAALKGLTFTGQDDANILVEKPQTGLVRVALQGDWTNAGKVSGDLRIERIKKDLGPSTAVGQVGQGDSIPIEVEVPAGTVELTFDLHFLRSWGAYPTSDIDLILVDPDGNLDFQGATFDGPERAVIANPTPGLWTVFVEGFTLFVEPDAFSLYATADGVRLPAN